MTTSLLRRSAVFAVGLVAAAGMTSMGATASAEPGGEVGALARACTTFYMGSGEVYFCKTWNWDGNDYDGSWGPEGPSDLPGGTYLERREDGRTISSSAWTGRYYDRDVVLFRVCNDLLGGCTNWW